jgi:hypothetical protein
MDEEKSLFRRVTMRWPGTVAGITTERGRHFNIHYIRCDQGTGAAFRKLFFKSSRFWKDGLKTCGFKPWITGVSHWFYLPVLMLELATIFYVCTFRPNRKPPHHLHAKVPEYRLCV